jgi:plasmid maintenance system antidote protein VapI
MTLQEHLQAKGITVAEFADSIAEARNTIRKIVYRQRQPSLDLAVKIQIATKGAVKPSDMLLTVSEGKIR